MSWNCVFLWYLLSDTDIVTAWWNEFETEENEINVFPVELLELRSLNSVSLSKCVGLSLSGCIPHQVKLCILFIFVECYWHFFLWNECKIGKNQISSIPTEIGGLTLLTRLDLGKFVVLALLVCNDHEVKLSISLMFHCDFLMKWM